MNENINLVEVLKDCPKGTRLYSLTCGECTLAEVSLDKKENYPIAVYQEGTVLKSRFTSNGKFYDTGDCLLFPSKDNRDWSTFAVPELKGESEDERIKQVLIDLVKCNERS